MKYPEYDSPIRLITEQISKQVSDQIDDMTMKAIQKCAIDIDKPTLIEALKQDSSRYREAYFKGYESGKAVYEDPVPKVYEHFSIKCGKCNEVIKYWYKHCPTCGRRIDWGGHEEDQGEGQEPGDDD